MEIITETHVAVAIVTLAEKQIYQWLWCMDVVKWS